MRHLIIGDVHGYFDNLREFLLAHGVINEKNERLDADTLKVYQTGDLIDGGKNRAGDLLLMEYAPEWFDGVNLGNHEMAFLGGKSFSGMRKNDRKTIYHILRLIEEGVYVPSQVVGKYLLTHGGFSERWGFKTADQADDYVRIMWEMSADADEWDDIPVLHWIGKVRGNYSSDDTGGVFQLDWTERRNIKFSQIVGHTHFSHGPIRKFFRSTGQEHWNVDVGGKMGKGIGGVLYDDEKNKTIPLFWGERYAAGNSKNTNSTVVTSLKRPDGETVYSTEEEDAKNLPILASQIRLPIDLEDDEVTHVNISAVNDTPLGKFWKSIGRAFGEEVSTNGTELGLDEIRDPELRDVMMDEMSRGVLH